MLPEGFQATVAVLLTIAPGFVATSIWARARTWQGPPRDLRLVLQSLALSLVVQVVVAPLTIIWLYPIRESLDQYPERVALWFFLVVIVLPVAGGLAIARVTDLLEEEQRKAELPGRDKSSLIPQAMNRVWRAATPPSVWDWLFLARPPHGSFVVVDFKDGSRLAGVFAEGSMAITSPERQGLFLISEWVTDAEGNIIHELPRTGGIMILTTDEIRTVRILKPTDVEGKDGEKPRYTDSQGRSSGPG